MKIKTKYFNNILVSILIFASSFSNLNGQTNHNKDEDGMVFTLAMMKNMFVNVNTNDAFVAIKVWTQEINKRMNLGMRPNPILYNDLDDLLKNIQKDNVSMVICNTVEYLQNKARLPVKPVLCDPNKDEFILLVRKKDKIKSISELRNKKLNVYVGTNANLANIWIKVALKESNLGEIETFFNEIKNGTTSSQVILSVFFGQSDICMVKKSAFITMSELNPQVGKSLEALKTSVPFIDGMACFTNKFLENSISSKVLKAAYDVDKYPSGKQIFKLLRTQQVSPFKEEYLESTKDLLKQYYELEKKR